MPQDRGPRFVIYVRAISGVGKNCGSPTSEPGARERGARNLPCRRCDQSNLTSAMRIIDLAGFIDLKHVILKI